MMKLLAILSAILLLTYPFAVYFGIDKLGIEAIAVVLILLFLIRILAGSKSKLKELKYLAWITGGIGIVLLSLGALLNQQGWLTYYPVVVSTCLLVVFWLSLSQEQSLIERFARLQEPQLDPKAVLYTRNVTKVWCVFFLINGSIALSTCFMPLSYWTLYNGFISYIAMGLLFAIEFIIRKQVQQKIKATQTGTHEQ
ncbi:hypothetical protein L3V77_12985 [Vibrio sp. DW001]|uniref:COG4648 family protein n=1 Tax=Vibrio sp. DW001 TaxID=2912315 RepID=UPI0023B0A47E|nr:hypothetical protein [Vibrio sp. DW001]WED28411.1 hypothetical protein L3V77_12985 [Vibrio sp. DW001]